MRKFSCAAAPLTLFIHQAFSARSEKEKLYNKYILNVTVFRTVFSENISLIINNLQRIMSDGDLIVDDNIELVGEGSVFISPDNDLDSVLATEKISSISEPELNPLQPQDAVLELLERVSTENSNSSIEEIIYDVVSRSDNYTVNPLPTLPALPPAGNAGVPSIISDHGTEEISLGLVELVNAALSNSSDLNTAVVGSILVLSAVGTANYLLQRSIDGNLPRFTWKSFLPKLAKVIMVAGVTYRVIINAEVEAFGELV